MSFLSWTPIELLRLYVFTATHAKWKNGIVIRLL